MPAFLVCNAFMSARTSFWQFPPANYKKTCYSNLKQLFWDRLMLKIWCQYCHGFPPGGTSTITSLALRACLMYSSILFTVHQHFNDLLYVIKSEFSVQLVCSEGYFPSVWDALFNSRPYHLLNFCYKEVLKISGSLNFLLSRDTAAKHLVFHSQLVSSFSKLPSFGVSCIPYFAVGYKDIRHMIRILTSGFLPCAFPLLVTFMFSFGCCCVLFMLHIALTFSYVTISPSSNHYCSFPPQWPLVYLSGSLERFCSGAWLSIVFRVTT